MLQMLMLVVGWSHVCVPVYVYLQHTVLCTVLERADNGSFAIVEHYPHQRSLAYGADWCYGEGGLVATAAFYERTVHVWKPKAVGGTGS